MELRGMVVMDGMAQLVDDDEIAQVFGKHHQEKAQRNVVRPGTATPLRTRGTDRQFVVLQPRDAGDPSDTVGQVGPGSAPQLLDAGFLLCRRQLRRPVRHVFGRAVRGRLQSTPPSRRETPKPASATPRGEMTAARRRPAHADRNAACAARLGEDDLTQPGMFDGRKHA